MVIIEDLTIGYDSNKPLVSIDKFTVNPGEVIVLTGESGIGKTTLLKTIAGLIEPISGKVTAPEKRGELGYIPQNLGLVRHATVMHNVMLGANAGHKQFWTPLPSSIAKDSALDAIDSLGISNYKFKIVRRLSGGERRRVATARTLAQKPKLILADEFLSELDEQTKEKVQSEVLNYITNNNSSIIIVEHDLIRAKEMSDRLFMISDGKLKEHLTEEKSISSVANEEE